MRVTIIPITSASVPARVVAGKQQSVRKGIQNARFWVFLILPLSNAGVEVSRTHPSILHYLSSSTNVLDHPFCDHHSGNSKILTTIYTGYITGFLHLARNRD
jgi:hypothetical protein